MFGYAAYIVFILIAVMIAASAIMTAVKLAVNKGFGYMYLKRLWIEYIVFFFISLIVMGILFGLLVDYLISPMIGNIIVFYLIVSVFEYLLFYPRYYSFESKKRYVFSLLVSNSLIMIIIDGIVIILFVFSLLFSSWM